MASIKALAPPPGSTRKPRLPNTLNVSLPGIRGESLVPSLDQKGGPSLGLGLPHAPRPPHALLAMGLTARRPTRPAFFLGGKTPPRSWTNPGPDAPGHRETGSLVRFVPAAKSEGVAVMPESQPPGRGAPPEICNYLDLDHRRIGASGEPGAPGRRKWLHCKYLYDQRGSERSRRSAYPGVLPHPHRYGPAERHAGEIMDFFALGGGIWWRWAAAPTQVRCLLESLSPRAARLRSCPRTSAKRPERVGPGAGAVPRAAGPGPVADYTRHLPPTRRAQVVVLLGSTLGNFNEEEGLELLQGVAQP